MARRFVRVDLSDAARDFRPIALEPGLAVLDRSNANGRLLFKWLGGLVAEPEWDRDSVNFFVQDDQGGRLEDVVGQPASDEDLQGLLKEDFAQLRDRLEKAKADLASRKTVERAKALLMKERGLDEDAAYRLLRKLSMDTGRPLGAVAADLLAFAGVLKGGDGQ